MPALGHLSLFVFCSRGFEPWVVQILLVVRQRLTVGVGDGLSARLAQDQLASGGIPLVCIGSADIIVNRSLGQQTELIRTALLDELKSGYAKLEKDLEALAAEKAALEAQLSSGTLPYDQLQAASERIACIIDETDEKELRLLELYECL